MTFCIPYLILLGSLNRDARDFSKLERSLVGQSMIWEERLCVKYIFMKFRAKVKAGFNWLSTSYTDGLF
jgi:hypothetical protein